MKKIMLLLLLVFVMSSFAFAQSNKAVQGQDSDSSYYNCPYPDCPLCSESHVWHGSKHNKGRKGMYAGEPVIVTAEQAKNAVGKYIQNLKGYYIESVESFNRAGHHITSYRVYVKDGSGNSFFFHVDPWGRLGGPIAYTKTK